VVEVDARWYKSLPEDPGASETWRDPFVFADPDGDGWRMLISARARDAARDDDGVLAQARSGDLREWEVGPPVCEPGAGFGQLEVAQVRLIDGTPTMVFTCHPQEQMAQRIARSGAYCTWSLTGRSLTGPWDIDSAQPFVDEPALFAAPLVQQRDGTWALLGFRNLEPEATPPFEIEDPIPVKLRDGALRSVR
jgi:beta-fructofuranosidase